MPRRARVGFIVARCGEEIYGGAERLAFQLASHLAYACDVELLTSCARDYTTWKNEYAPGPGFIGAIPAHRFAVDRPRDAHRFDALCERLADDPAHAPNDVLAAWAAEQGPRVLGLREHLHDTLGTYDALYFVSYLYATTYAAIDAAARKAILIPLAHEEWMLRLPLYDRTFAAAEFFTFVSDEERALIARRFPGLETPSATIGSGVDVPADVDGRRFRAKYGLGDDRLDVYVGRVDAAKGIDALLADFDALRAADPRPRTLVLAGPITGEAPDRPGVRAIGPVDETTKFDALAAAEAAIVPSQFESLSIVALEALAVGTPIVVNGASEVMVGHCRRSNAGLWYAGRDEFVELFRSDLCGARDLLAARGRTYVERNYTWPAVASAHVALVERVRERSAAAYGPS
jgi:glycosyltransferase involved in cell wall biosynthesis